MEKLESIEEQLSCFKLLVSRGEYYRAHEVLEKPWREMKRKGDPDQDIIKGFINAAVSLELRKKGRSNHKKVWQTYEKHSAKIANNELYSDLKCFLDRLCYNPEN